MEDALDETITGGEGAGQADRTSGYLQNWYRNNQSSGSTRSQLQQTEQKPILQVADTASNSDAVGRDSAVTKFSSAPSPLVNSFGWFSNASLEGTNRLDKSQTKNLESLISSMNHIGNSEAMVPVTPASPGGSSVTAENAEEGEADENDELINDMIKVTSDQTKIRRPRSSHEFPLAGEPTPTYLQSFRFVHNGIESIFREVKSSSSMMPISKKKTSKPKPSRVGASSRFDNNLIPSKRLSSVSPAANISRPTIKHYIPSLESIENTITNINPGTANRGTTTANRAVKRYRIDRFGSEDISEVTPAGEDDRNLTAAVAITEEIDDVEVVNIVNRDKVDLVDLADDEDDEGESDDNYNDNENVDGDEVMIVRETHGSPHMSLPSPSASPMEGNNNSNEQHNLFEDDNHIGDASSAGNNHDHEDSETADDGRNLNNNSALVLASPRSVASSPSSSSYFSSSALPSSSLLSSSVIALSNRSSIASSCLIQAQPESAKASLTNIPDVIDNFDELPQQLKRYVLYNLLKRCDRTTLSIMSSIIVPSLRCDFLSLLPLELSCNILSYLDHRSLCRAAQVSKNWKSIVDSSEWVWKSLLHKDDFGVTSVDYLRAVKERWDYTSWGSMISTGAIAASATSIGAPPTSVGVATDSGGTPRSLISEINVYKAIYRRKYLIHQNWMNPQSRPKHLQVRGHGHDVVTCLQFDDERIITGSDDNTINVYDTKTGELLHQFTGHDGGVWALKYINKRTLISGATDRTVRVWDIEKGRCTHVFYGHTSTVRCLDIIDPVPYTDRATGEVTYKPSEPIIVTGSRDATLRMWRLPSEDEEYMVPPPGHQGHPVGGGAGAGVQGNGGVGGGGEDTEQGNDPYFLRSLRGHTNSVRAISGYGDTVVSGSYDTTVRVWSVSTGECRWELTGHAQRVYSAVLDHKRNRCISGSMDWFVKVWCIETGTLLYTLEGHTSLVGLLDLNRTTLVSAAADSTLRVWDPETGAFLHKLQGHQGAITCFQHDENKVVSGSEKTLKLWDIRSGNLVRDLLVDLSGIWQVCFDERRCVAAVKRDNETYIEVLDFDYDPFT